MLEKNNKEKYILPEIPEDVLNSLMLGVYVVNNEGVIEFFNKKMVEINGAKSADEVIGLNALKLDSYIKYGLDKYIKKGLEGEPFRIKELHYVSHVGKKESYRNYEGIPIRDESGKVIKLLCLVEDVTEKKKIELALTENEKKYRFFVESSSEAIMIIGKSGKLKFVNNFVCQFSGYEKEELIGKPITKFLAKESIPNATKALALEFLGHEQPPFEIGIKTRAGETKYLELGQGSNFVHDKGKIVGMLVNGHDISQRKETEVRLKESEERHRSLLDRLDGYVLIISKSEKIVYANRKVMDDSGYSKEELINSSITKFLTKKSIAVALPAIANDFMGRPHSGLEIEVVNKSGEIIICRVNGNSPIIKEKGKTLGVLINAYNITEQKKAKQELVESEKKYRLLFDTASDVIVVIDTKGKIKDLNYQFEKESGYKRDGFIGKNVFNCGILTKTSIAKAMFHFKNMLVGKPIQTFEVEAIIKDGSRVPYELVSVPLFENGKNIGVQATLRNITERKKSESKIKKSEEEIRFINESVLDVIFTLTKTGKISYISPSALEYFGFKPEEMIGDSFSKYAPKEELEKLSSKHNEVFNKRRVNNFETAIKRRDGKTIPVEINARLVRRNEKTEVQGAIRDIRQRKKAEEKIRESEELFRTLIENAPIGIYYNDLKGNFLYGNKKAEEIVGYSREELVGKNMLKLKLLSTKDILRASKTLALNKGGKINKPAVFNLMRKDGAKRTVEINNSFINIGGKSVILGMVQDVSDRRKAEQARKSSENRFDILAEATTDGIFISDKYGRVIYVNPALEKFIGLPNDKIVGKHFTRFITKKSAVITGKLFFGLSRRKLQFVKATEVELVNNNKKIIPMEASAFPVLKNNKFIGMEGVIRDISDRKKSEHALLESEQKYREMTERSFDMIYTTDKLGKLTYVSPVVKSMLGIYPEEAIGKHISTFIAKKDIPRILKLFSKKITGEEVPIFEMRMPTKNRGEIIVEQNADLIIKNGKIIGVQGIIRDISERKNAEKKILESEKRLQHIIEHSNEMYYIHDTKHELLYVSQQSVPIFGYTPEEMMMNWTELTTENPINEEGFKLTELALRTGERQKPYILELKRKDGKIIYAEIDEAPNKDDEGKIIGMVGALRDITEREKAKQALMKKEEQSRMISDVTSDFTYSYQVSKDKKLEFEWVTEAFQRVTGYKVNEITKRGGWEFLIEKEDHRHCQKQLESLFMGKASTIEYRIKTKKGLNLWMRDYANPVMDKKTNQLKYIYGAVQDITERKEAEEAIRTSEDNYRSIFNSVSDTIVIISIGSRKIVDVNINSESMFGYSRSEILELPPGDLSSDKNSKLLDNKISQAIEAGPQNFEWQAERKEGDKFWLEIGLKKVKIGGIERIIAILHDVTLRKLAEEEVRNASREWSETFDSMAAGVSIHSTEHKIINVNKTLEKLLNKPKKEIIGRSCFEVFHNKISPIKGCPLSKALKSNKRENLEYYEPAFGRWLSVSANPVKDKNNKVEKIIHIIRDITERKEAEEELKKKYIELEKSNKLMIGREMRMIELKKRIKELEKANNN